MNTAAFRRCRRRFFIGRDGKIVDRIIGLKGDGDIEDSIKKALNTQAASNHADAGRGLAGSELTIGASDFFALYLNDLARVACQPR